ncbi:hypothetical protein CEXT_547361 [Caerostris extrusa]|uniref:Uncharacterized protein n=1 Tax=Caerostris extrusa TaxID=172846 RepID=A0AAV4WDV0_CAEEX|nr:hypothetical protein CEXT_547361 [Caerostris extrusa]
MNIASKPNNALRESIAISDKKSLEVSAKQFAKSLILSLRQNISQIKGRRFEKNIQFLSDPVPVSAPKAQHRAVLHLLSALKTA